MEHLLERLAAHALIGLDTCIFIYHLERHPKYFTVTQPLLRGIETGGWQAVASTVAVMEVMVRPWQLERRDVVRDYEAILAHFPNLELVDATLDVAREAARLRAQYTLRPADALHVATALISGATAFVTNDRDFAQVKDVDVVLLSDFSKA